MADLKLGPQHLEQTLSARLNISKLGDDRLRYYLSLITPMENELQRAGGQGEIPDIFALAYIYYQAGKRTETEPDKQTYLENSRKYYRQAIAKKPREGEIIFMSYFSMGAIEYILGYGWKHTEEMFLQAYQAYPSRAESIARIIQHYLSQQEWQLAHIFSGFAVKQFYHRSFPQENWGVEKELYLWKVLELHTAASYSAGKMQEASEAFLKLYLLSVEHPELFPPEKLRSIADKRKLFPKLESVWSR